MVGTPLVIVKKRDGQFTLSSFHFFSLLSSSRAGPNCLLLRASNPTRFLLHTQLKKAPHAFADPLFLTGARGPC
jgi:hypothetical protein